MMRLLVLIAVLAGLGPGAQAAPADEAWRRDGLANPWSAWLDVEHDIIYVANVAGDPQAKDGNGFIAQLDLKGEIVRRDWAIGLDAPKGISGMGGQLYVADIDRIVALDLATGAVTGTWPVPGAQALTDVYAAQRSGRVFVSDARTDTIWVLQDGQLKQFAHGPELRGPAGLRINRGRLVVAGMGDDAAPGGLAAIELESGRIAELGPQALRGHLLGLDAIGDRGWYVSDPVTGTVAKLDAGGALLEQQAVGKGAADLALLGEQGLLLVPMSADDRLLALRVEPLPK